ncbi:glycosyltransferase [Microbacterium sp. XT11]|uniref:glycosyltransferase n=1 Tax=Microbacterium sp. XT11 TaxID=367477 RepID=UPI000742E7D0|nr:glycosyltransferase [Microbacterium sp. XT11]ALX66682.1 hypothetical protein AB663_002010 [Microbacterium sp. XT11]
MPGHTPDSAAKRSTLTASVCMATYNGAKYLMPQLESILTQLRPDDELVIVDDASTDGTVELLESVDDARITVVRNERNLGYVKTFERAMSLASRDVLLLSDQDDLWTDGRLEALVSAASAGGVVASNLLLLGSETPLRSPLTGKPWLLSHTDDGRTLRNELRLLAGNAPYFGCALAIRREALDLLLPFPEFLYESHDLWIVTAANTAGSLRHIDRATVLRRIHEDNASAERPRSILAALTSRVLLIRLWCEATRRVMLRRRS